MEEEGMREPMLTVIDGCPGLIKAVVEVFPESDKQRSTKHKAENVLEKDRASAKESVRKIFYVSTYEHAKEAVNAKLYIHAYPRGFKNGINRLNQM